MGPIHMQLAKALYEALPNFLCGNKNKKEDKIEVCFKGKDLCIDRSAAPGFIQKGAYLGGCNQTVSQAGNNTITNVQTQGELQDKLTAFPNPFTNRVTLSFSVIQPGPASLRIYDINGKLVSTVFNGVAGKGVIQQVNLEAGNLPAGVYISRLQTVNG